MTTLMLSILAVWFVAIFLGPPLWLAMSLAGWAFLAIAGIPDLALAQRIAKAADSFPLLAAPLFILMGNIMNGAGITRRIFAFATVCVGWMRGGLCHANIVASVFFAGTSGSAVADAGGLGTLEDIRRDPSRAAALLRELLGDDRRRQELRARGWRLVDGQGRRRVADALLDLTRAATT